MIKNNIKYTILILLSLSALIACTNNNSVDNSQNQLQAIINHTFPDDPYVEQITEESIQRIEKYLFIKNDVNPIEDLLGEWNLTTYMGIYTNYENISFDKDGKYYIYAVVTDGNTAIEESFSGYYYYNNNTISFYAEDETGNKELISSAMVFIKKEQGKKLLFLLWSDAYFSLYEMPYEGTEDTDQTPTGIYYFAENWEKDRCRLTIIDAENQITHFLTTSNIAGNKETFVSYDYIMKENKVYLDENYIPNYYEFRLFENPFAEYLFLFNKEDNKMIFALKPLKE